MITQIKDDCMREAILRLRSGQVGERGSRCIKQCSMVLLFYRTSVQQNIRTPLLLIVERSNNFLLGFDG